MTGTDIGGRVRRAREERGWSLGDTARITKLSPAVLRAIERNQFDTLPAGMYRKAYVRTVAAEVGLDAAALAAEYEAQYEAPIEPAAAMIEMAAARNHCVETLQPSRRRDLAVWIVLLMLLAAWFAFQLEGVPGRPQAVAETGRLE